LTRGAVKDYLDQLHLLPKDITTKLNALDKATPTVNKVQQHIDNMHGKDLPIKVVPQGNFAEALAGRTAVGASFMADGGCWFGAACVAAVRGVAVPALRVEQ
ncbi:MAG TPA: hypothetical protein VE441_00115, partial [Mycobacterium sp.]|nr:hypothetical protein [Mycobacterium sp.]